MGGHYVLDEYGDRDVNYSIIYTSTVTGKVRLEAFCHPVCCQFGCAHQRVCVCVFLQYTTLAVFDSSTNETRVIDMNPSLPWKDNRLPDDVPEDRHRNIYTHTHTHL